HVKMPLLKDVIALFGDPFTDANETWEFLENWDRMINAGFTFRQLNYVLQDRDDPVRPLGPSQIKVLQLSKTLFDGLNAIDQAHEDLPPEDKNDPASKEKREAVATIE